MSLATHFERTALSRILAMVFGTGVGTVRDMSAGLWVVWVIWDAGFGIGLLNFSDRGYLGYSFWDLGILGHGISELGCL